MSEGADAAPRRGRRAGNPDTRGTILSAAHTVFTARGFDRTSIRAVAREAGVDPALVHHYFDDKASLLLATAAITIDPRRLVRQTLAGDRRTLGPRLVATILGVWESPLGTTLVQVLRRQPALFRAFTRVVSTEAIAVGVAELGFTGRDAQDRIALLETVIGGMFMSRYVAQMEPMATLPRRDVVRLIGPVVQQILGEQAARR